ncbi:MAG: peptidase dimerization domain-containing protein [Candidatus Eisenbacteria bacterium]
MNHETELDQTISRLATAYRPLAVEILKEAIRIPADYVDRPVSQGGDPACGLSNHEGPRLEYLRAKIVEIGAVDRPEDVGFDAFGNLVWHLEDPTDGIEAAKKTVIYWDGHTDTVQALRSRWIDAIGGGIDAYLGLVDPSRIDREFLVAELGYLPPEDEWSHLVWGRGSADQLGGVVCQIVASKILRETRALGSLHGVLVRSYGTVAEEDNDGGGPMYVMRTELPTAGPERVPDVVILTEGTGCSRNGAVGIYRGQRGRMQIEVDLVGKSCHGSMPWEGRNPLEFGGAILAEAAQVAAAGTGFGADDFLGPGTRTASFATLDTPSDCAVPERFTFRFDRRLTAGEDPEKALADVASLGSVARAREAGLEVTVSTPYYDQPTWRSYVGGNAQVYPGWVTPEDHPAITCAIQAYARCATPTIASGGTNGGLRRDPRLSRWVFSTDGVGYPLRRDDDGATVGPAKRWIDAGPFHHPPMFGIGPGIEQNTHKIGECVDSRELDPVIATLARFPSLYRASAGDHTLT